MSFIDTIVKADRELLILLNNFGSEPFDIIWLTFTKPVYWSPLFLLWIYFLIKRYDRRVGLFIFFFMVVMAGLSDTLVNIIKHTTLRPRPCWQEGVMESIRILKCTHSYSFVSGHATTSMALTAFIFFVFRDKYKWFWIFFIFPAIFAYSRIYMGKHYPLDIISGYILGFVEAIFYYKLVQYLLNKWFYHKKRAV
ncbi:phosphatase PAP2 family protein [Wenyingzhuangia sp. IMCC45533]